MWRLMSNRRGDARKIPNLCPNLCPNPRAFRVMRRARAASAIAALLGAWLAAERAHAAVPAPDPIQIALAQEPSIPGEGVEADYLRALHERIHPLWTGLFIHGVAEKAPSASPLNSVGSHAAAILFSVRWDGSTTDVTLVGSSGATAFDLAAVAAIRRVDDFPVPPVAVLSDDGLAHFRWVLARDSRLCSGGELHRFEEPLEEALPHLLIQGRVEEALWRLDRRAVAHEPESQDALMLFARAWLARPQGDPVTDGRAAAALARAGDQGQVPRLRVALGRRDTVDAAASALRGLNVEICPLVAQNLGANDPVTREIAMQALSAAGGRLPPTSPCVEALGAIVQDPTRDGHQRALAARAVASISADGARKLLGTVLADREPEVRAAAVSLLARPAPGRTALYRWLPFLHDPEVAVRAAAAAALVRCCGDKALEQLVLVWKEPYPQVAVAVANELGRMSSVPSEAFLNRLAKRRDPAVHEATTEALLARRALGAHPPAVVNSAVPAGAPSPEVAPAVRAVTGLARQQAIEWVLKNFDRLDRTDLVEVFGAWLHPSGSTTPPSVSAR
jgi:TonB family protein